MHSGFFIPRHHARFTARAEAGIISGIVLMVNGNTVEGASTLVASVVGYLLAEGLIDAKRVKTVIDSTEEDNKD